MDLKEIIAQIMESKGLTPPNILTDDMDLRDDLGFDSLDLAELTVKIEAETNIDIFADGLIRTIGEIKRKVQK